MKKYIDYFYSKFEYAVIGWYIAIVFSVTFTFVLNGFFPAVFQFLMVELVFGIIMVITYLIEKYITKTYK